MICELCIRYDFGCHHEIIYYPHLTRCKGPSKCCTALSFVWFCPSKHINKIWHQCYVMSVLDTRKAIMVLLSPRNGYNCQCCYITTHYHRVTAIPGSSLGVIREWESNDCSGWFTPGAGLPAGLVHSWDVPILGHPVPGIAVTHYH